MLGQGGFGLVKLARHLASGKYVAVKILQDASPSSPLSAHGEAAILRSLRHDNIVRLLEERHTRKHLFLVMELATRGSLQHYVLWQGGLAEDEARALFGQALAAVSYCHGQRVAHRDLKLGNLLLDEHMTIKLADFGLSLRLERGTLVRGFWGTPEYCAPEVFLEEDYDAFKADVWSLGVVLFAMLEATLPFPGKDTDKVLQDRVLCGVYVVPRGISPALQRPGQEAGPARGRQEDPPVPAEGMLHPAVPREQFWSLLPQSGPQVALLRPCHQEQCAG
uniref:non-specific serine/threonine protein kinase n=1 Tax=Oryctolagus cuniculus TaxID=9986 RepID=A0A5F9CP62_RABIT